MHWQNLFRRADRDLDHAREFQSFLEMETEENMHRGMSPEAARRAAHLKFGNQTAIREQAFEMNGIGFLETLGRDIWYAGRTLKAAPTFTVVSLLTLALGIGATAAIFTVVNGVILRPLPFPGSDRLVTIWETNPSYRLPGRPPGAISFSPGNYLDLREQNHSFEQVGALATTSYNLTGGAFPDRVTGGLVSASLLAELRLRPAIGRLFLRSDDSVSAERVAIISYGLWMQRFGGSATAIGSALRLDDRSHTIVGVMPRNFGLMNVAADVWLPLERKTTPEDMHWRQSYYLRVVGRLKPGISLEQARQDVDQIVRGIRSQFPADLGKGGIVAPLLDNTIAQVKEPLLILFGAVGFVLLICCLNVANLNLGRAITRRREIALRLALGAGRGRLARQLFTESMLLALGGAAGGLCLAEFGYRTLLRLAGDQIPRAAEIHIDTWVLGFAALAATLSGLAFGLFSALAASKVDQQEGLRGSDRSSSAGPGALRARNLLVISEIAFGLILMIGAGLLIESFRHVAAVDPGFDPRGLLTMRVALSHTRYDTLERQNALYKGILDRLRDVPGMQSAGAIDGLPFSDGGFDNAFSLDGRPEPPVGQPLKADIRRIDAGYFAAMRIPLAAGRAFTSGDGSNAPSVAIVSQSMARKYWPQESAVGKRLTIHFGPPEGIKAEIVGVATDVHPGLDALPGDYIYLHYPQSRSINQMDLVLRADERSQAGGSGAFRRAARAAVASVDPDLPVYRAQTMDELMSVSLATRRFETMLLGMLAALAACLAAVGLYGVLAYAVQSRTREIGIRAALGVNHKRVFAMVLMEALKLTAAGLAVGILGSFCLTRLLSNLLFRLQPTDPWTFTAVSLLLLLVALSAGYLPARRAARIDPVIALRHE